MRQDRRRGEEKKEEVKGENERVKIRGDETIRCNMKGDN